jgi:hypothetical protein
LEYTSAACRLWLKRFRAWGWSGDGARQAIERYIDLEAFVARALGGDENSPPATLAPGATHDLCTDTVVAEQGHLTEWTIGDMIATFRQIQVIVSAAGLDHKKL